MKKVLLSVLLSALSLSALTSCNKSGIDTPTPEPNKEAGIHFDIWMPTDPSVGMSSGSYIVHRASNLESGEISPIGTGAEVAANLTPNTIIRGKYYYQITKDKKFCKYLIHSDRVEEVSAFPIADLKDRTYCHAWIDDRTVVLLGASGDAQKILWVKVDVEGMRELDKGILELKNTPPKGLSYTTSGLAAYRPSDGKILYSFHFKGKGMTGSYGSTFYMAFVDAKTMKVEKEVSENRAEMMAGTAFGELRQSKSFFDEKGDYYLACNSVIPGIVDDRGKAVTTAQHGALLRIKDRQLEFDKSYNGYPLNTGKIITVNYLNNGKAILYMQNPAHATPANPVWNSKTNPYVFYWLILDLQTKQITELKDVPYGDGNFSQLAVVMSQKVYIGNNTKDESSIYIYDIATGKVTKGAKLTKGFTFERIVPMTN